MHSEEKISRESNTCVTWLHLKVYFCVLVCGQLRIEPAQHVSLLGLSHFSQNILLEPLYFKVKCLNTPFTGALKCRVKHVWFKGSDFLSYQVESNQPVQSSVYILLSVVYVFSHLPMFVSGYCIKVTLFSHI